MVENKLDFEQLDNADYFYLCHHFYFPKHIQGKQQLHDLKFFFFQSLKTRVKLKIENLKHNNSRQILSEQA